MGFEEWLVAATILTGVVLYLVLAPHAFDRGDLAAALSMVLWVLAAAVWFVVQVVSALLRGDWRLALITTGVVLVVPAYKALFWALYYRK